MSSTKCWDCKHSVPATDRRGRQTAGCEWSLYKCPVPGWSARQSVTIYKGKRTESYEVYECPRFERG